MTGKQIKTDAPDCQVAARIARAPWVERLRSGPFAVTVLWCIFSFLAPGVVIGALGEAFFSDLVVPVYVLKPVSSETSINLFLEFAKILFSMSIGMAIAALWLYRRPLKISATTFGHVVLILALSSALASIYCGLRFIFDAAKQLQYVHFDFDAVASRLYWQGAFAALQLSLLCLSGALYFFRRDRRYDGGKN